MSGPITAEMLRRDMFNEDQGGSEYERGYRKGHHDRGWSLIAQLLEEPERAALDLAFKHELVKGRG
jgi:hypothetical protein